MADIECPNIRQMRTICCAHQKYVLFLLDVKNGMDIGTIRVEPSPDKSLSELCRDLPAVGSHFGFRTNLKSSSSLAETNLK